MMQVNTAQARSTVYKQVTKPPVKITCTCMERKPELHLIFIPQMCHTFCSFNGFRQLGWNSQNAVCGTETRTLLYAADTDLRFTAGRWLTSICCFFCWRLWSEFNSFVYWLAKTHLMWLLTESTTQEKNTSPLLKGSIRQMLTFVRGTIGFPAPNVNQSVLV